MAKSVYIGVNDAARKVNKIYVGVDGVARKVKKGYIGVNGVARLFFGAVHPSTMGITYTGDWTDQKDVVFSDGKTYRLLTLTTSGTLTVEDTIKADIWMCAGGNGGMEPYDGTYGTFYGTSGGGGGMILQANNHQVLQSTVCLVGSGGNANLGWSARTGIGGASSFGELVTPEVPQGNAVSNYKSINGASGGGGFGGSNTKIGQGMGVSTVPFLDTALFEAHSAGGGEGGSYIYESKATRYKGGAGGSDGSNGSGGTKISSGTCYGGEGGVKGGGAGGRATSVRPYPGESATFYGSGGGGGAWHEDWEDDPDNGERWEYDASGGHGYQGVIYVRIPYDQE